MIYVVAYPPILYLYAKHPDVLFLLTVIGFVALDWKIYYNKIKDFFHG